MELSKDLRSRQEARDLAAAGERAARALAELPQEKLDEIVAAVASAFAAQAEKLAEEAVKETGFGNIPDKTTKNKFASLTLLDALKGKKYVGLLREDEEKGVWEYGVPVGVIAAIVPSTNPTSTVCYKAMIALKSGNAIIFSPHPNAAGCTRRAAQIVAEAAEAAGAPRGSVGCLSIPELAGCQELMAAPQTRRILATGGPGMVRAAYSSGKPAIGVGAGNGPAYIHHSADVPRAMEDILTSKTFDFGTVCASEQSILVEKGMEEAVVREGKRLGFYFLTSQEAKKLAQAIFLPSGGINPKVVGKPAEHLAQLAGFSVPEGTKILVARENEAGPAGPYTREKLCPVLALFVLSSEEAVLQKAIEVLDREGSGHTFSIHAADQAVIRRFAAKIPVSRFLVNTPATQGGIGATTGLFPAMTLGCGAVGGSSSSNNISPMDLINIRRVAFGRRVHPPKARVELTPELLETLTQRILERLG